MAQAIQKNVQRLAEAHGLSSSELSRRVGLDERDMLDQLGDDSPPSNLLKALAAQLLVPDFALLVSGDLPIAKPIIDFRSEKPTPNGFSRSTLKAIELGQAIQAGATELRRPKQRRTLAAAVGDADGPRRSAKRLRASLELTDSEQLGSPDARRFYALVRQRIEARETIVIQYSYDDGSGYCLADDDRFDLLCINTLNSIHSRRIFTLAHEVYHAVIGRSGLSDIEISKNRIERECNQFAAEFLAPADLVRTQVRALDLGSQFDVNSLGRLSRTLKLSMYAAVIRLVELEIWPDSSIGSWNAFVGSRGNPDFPAKKQGGGKSDEWKTKLARYGFLTADIFGTAARKGQIDAVDIYRTTGLKPKYQKSYFENASIATSQDVEDE